MPTKEEWRIANKVWDAVFGIEYDVESMSYQRRGDHYTVKRHGDGHWSCDCKSWIFKSATKDVTLDDGTVVEDTCKHIRFCMEKDGIEYKIIRSW